MWKYFLSRTRQRIFSYSNLPRPSHPVVRISLSVCSGGHDTQITKSLSLSKIQRLYKIILGSYYKKFRISVNIETSRILRFFICFLREGRWLFSSQPFTYCRPSFHCLQLIIILSAFAVKTKRISQIGPFGTYAELSSVPRVLTLLKLLQKSRKIESQLSFKRIEPGTLHLLFSSFSFLIRCFMNKLHLIVDTNVRPPTLHKKNNAPAP